ncbi:lipoprotein signal peptidase [Ligilactobacillus hayakitensis DSM 18933 = JCM 14209]|uniref:Lipoprotein signal peptidase n=1 Tax=Ligilactobacillus hayakitensis DSM 18933 = JCM 14209 TaxID=1423755 RepID=A0A0R1WMN1_9LACO|nr:signal peptidase II [Ligilactobacillus hayakitensis]KRM19007.1 lipoprotein signal peptidase [Ligilactobacillus hayakitensis DSM 18933 = JCM 14209]
MWGYFIVIILLVMCDQGIKLYVVQNINEATTNVIIPNVLGLTNIKNDGAAWSVLSGKMWIFYIISVVALMLMIYYFYKYRNDIYFKLGLTFLISGTIGNFIDRIRLGYVVDMFETLFLNFPIFNFADTCLTIGVIIVIVALFKEEG